MEKAATAGLSSSQGKTYSTEGADTTEILDTDMILHLNGWDD